jgi:hypothetical protein
LGLVAALKSCPKADDGLFHFSEPKVKGNAVGPEKRIRRPTPYFHVLTEEQNRAKQRL